MNSLFRNAVRAVAIGATAATAHHIHGVVTNKPESNEQKISGNSDSLKECPKNSAPLQQRFQPSEFGSVL